MADETPAEHVETRDDLEQRLEAIEELVDSRDAEELDEYLDNLPPGESARALSRMSTDEQSSVVTLLEPADAAQLFEELPEQQVVDLVEHLSVEHAAAIVSQMQSDDQVDLLENLHPDNAEAILREMEPSAAEQLEHLRRYARDSAGGLMITEYLAYPRDFTVGDVLADMVEHSERYASYDVQYTYVTSPEGELVGVLRLRDLLLTPRDTPLARKMILQPLSVKVTATLESLDQFFGRHPLLGVPVVDQRNKLVGVVRLENVEEALGERADRTFLKFAGIIGGEELRSMPFSTRSARRLSWLVLNILLNIVAASVIAFYEETLAAVIALAVFLPMISNMSGSAGNQAVAVSMRELVLGLIRPYEYGRVILKEATLGLVNGVALGAILGVLAWLWQDNVYLGLVVGVALAFSMVFAVVLGGCLPLLLRRLNLDSALISAPVLTTTTDMCAFLLVLGMASQLVPLLTGG